MSLEDGRRLYRQTHGRYDADNLPPADTVTARAMLRQKAKRGDDLAAKALEQWQATQENDSA